VKLGLFFVVRWDPVGSGSRWQGFGDFDEVSVGAEGKFWEVHRRHMSSEDAVDIALDTSVVDVEAYGDLDDGRGSDGAGGAG
jgi:hypothetical protein